MIILASTSPRRREILGRFVDFEVKTKEIDENNSDYESPEQLVMALSFEKGIEVALENENDIVIAADTIVSYDGKVLGKPEDYEDAFNMIKTLSGTKHEVLTGYSIFKVDEDIKYTDYVRSIVYFKDLTDDAIRNYLNTKEYVGKAGAYGIQGFGGLLVEKIDGDFENIVGLPISRIYDKLKSLFNLDLLKGVLDDSKLYNEGDAL